MKRQKMPDWIFKKARPNYTLCTRHVFRIQDADNLKEKGQRIYQPDTNRKRARELRDSKARYTPGKSITGETAEHFPMRKGSFHQEDAAVLRVHAPSNVASDDTGQRLAEQ